MIDTTRNTFVKAITNSIRAISSIWLIPIVSLLIGVWMVYQTWSHQGPLIVIEFSTAHGLEAGKTKIKTRSFDIGKVEKITLKKDLSGVLVQARLSKAVESLLKEDTRFWVVSPKVSSGGVSGLGTLLSGAYIELSPGVGGSPQFQHYIGLENAPVTPAGTPGLHVTLESHKDFTFSEGDPVLYRGFKVGTIENVYFDIDERTVDYNAFIKAPYHNLITVNTAFWRMNGMSFDLSANGLKVETGTLESFLGGGVAFEVPTGRPLGERITERAYFKVHSDYDSIRNHRSQFVANYLLRIEDSVSGLAIGAPVEFRGVNIGQVISIGNSHEEPTNLLEKNSHIPVMIAIEPVSVGLEDSVNGVTNTNLQMQRWIQEGLKATLKTGNLLIGSQLVELSYYEDRRVQSVEQVNGLWVIPVALDDFTRIGSNLSDLINKLNNLPLHDIVSNADKLLVEGATTFAHLNDITQSLALLMDQSQDKNLPNSIHTTLDEITLLMKSFSSGSQTHTELQATLTSLNAVLNELEPVLLLLKNQPNSLIFSGKRADQQEPKKAQ